LVLGGRLHRGAAGSAAEVGHMVVAVDGPACVCGRRGCVQALASGPAVLRETARRRGGPVDADGVAAGVRAREGWAVEPVRSAGRALAVAALSVAELVQPSCVRIGGGFAAVVPELVAEARLAVAAMARAGRPAPLVEPAGHGGLSSLRGAELLALGLGLSTLERRRDRD